MIIHIQGLTKDDLLFKEMKHRRRTLKNRNYAAISRKKEEAEEAKLEKEKDRLEVSIVSYINH